jgi:hypothetical protein
MHEMQTQGKGAQGSHMFKARTLKRLMLATLGALVLALAASAPAGAVWSEPKYLNNAFLPAELPAEIDTDSDEFYFVYADGSGMVRLKKFSATGAAAGSATITPRPTDPEAEASAESPNLGVNSLGDSAYAWLTTNKSGARTIIMARTRSRTGQLGPARTLLDIGQAEGEVELPEVAVDADGDAVIAWTQISTVGAEQGTVKARTLSKTGVLGPIKTISTSGTGALAEFVQVDMRPTGETVFVWQFAQRNIEGQIQYRTMSSTGALSSIRTASRLESSFPDFSMASNGAGLISWIYADPFAGGLNVQARTLSETGALGPIKNISPRGGEVLEQNSAYSSNGVAAFTYTLKDPVVGKTAVYGRNMSSTGALGPVRTLAGASASGDVTFPDVGISNSGRAVFTWLRPVPAGDRLESNTMTSAGVLGTKRTITTQPSLVENRMAVLPTGPAATSWVDLSTKQIAVSFGP